MLSQAQRAALTERLRRDRGTDAAGPIARRDAATLTPVASFGQEQLWFIDKFASGQAVYNVPCLIELRGPLDSGALSRALDCLLRRHEALRTRLVTGDGMTGESGRPVQVVDPPMPAALGMADLSGFEPGKREARLREFVHTEALRPFDLAAGPLLRTCLVRLDDAEHALVSVFHHVVFDGWSAGVFLRDLAELYRAEVSGQPSGLAELPVQFGDYAVWERERLRGQALADLQAWWRQALDGFETVQFPTDRPRPVVDDFAGGVAERTAGDMLLAGLRELSRREGSTLFATVLAGLLALLYRYTGQSDLVVGTVSASRDRTQLAPLIGFLVNTLPVRCDVSGDPEFTELLARVKDATVGAFAHQDLPFGKLVDTLGVQRDASRAPVFQIAFTYADSDDSSIPAAGVDFALSDLVRGIEAAKFDLTFAAEARGNRLWIECCYKTALFDPGTIERLLVHLETLLRGAVADPGARLSRLPLLTDADLRAELANWNDTDAPVPPGCVHERFEAQVAAVPDAIAAEFGGDRVSYAELNRRANQVARRLRQLGVGPEVLVGIRMRTSLRRCAVLLGVLKAGGGYLPLDPGLPEQRLAFMIADAGAAVVLSDEDDWDQIDGLDGGNLVGTGVTPGNVAYVIYTSGSTGQPKGVLVEHRNVVNFVHGMVGRWEIGPGSAVLAASSFAFDASIIDVFVPLLAGARVVLAPPEKLHSPPRLAALLRDARITLVLLTPAVLGLLPAGDYPDLRVLMVGGEEMPAALARRWIRPGLRLVNSYGPTEITVIATWAELDASTPMPPPIGLPFWPNCRAYVLDRQLNPVPVGVTGELHVGGAGVARGYLNRPELTSQRFVPDPFRPGPGARLYKTGDLVRRRTDGSIVYAGRTDGQVKIRGLRIELGEIETALAAHPAIAQAIVTVVTSPAGEKELAAYLRPVLSSSVLSSSVLGSSVPGAVSDQDLRAHLARTLPAWMIPAHLITVEAFPLNSSGKVDRKALPSARRPAEAAPQTAAPQTAAPQTAAEAELVGIYAALLGIDRVGADDSFFDLGGNSLTVMRLIDAVNRVTGADIAVTSVFLHPTPRGLAAVLGSLRGGRQAGSGPVVELSEGTAEPPLFLVHAVEGTVSAYVPLSQELAGTFKVYGLEAPALSGAGPIAGSLGDLVTDYAQRIKAVQPTGPYRLAGWSMGGVIAFELAQRLEQAPGGVDLLVLLDAPFAVPADFVPENAAELAGRFVADVAHSVGLDCADAPDPVVTTSAGQLAWLAERLDGPDPVERDLVAARLRHRFSVFEAHSRVLAGYQSTAGSRVGAPTLVVSAGGSLNAQDRSRWPRVFSGPLEVMSVDSDHYAFLRPPLVADVGAAIRGLRDQMEACADGR